MESNQVRIVQVDAFTDRPFAGNPAAVCLLDGDRPDDWLAAVAQEMNLSETAFLRPDGDAWSLRWFTPAVEVDLCGHATLAAAHVLWEDGVLAPDRGARFRTRSGELGAERRDDGAIALDFPARPPQEQQAPEGLAEALGTEVRWSGRNREDWLIELADEATVRGLVPDIAALRNVNARGIIVTARAADPEAPYHFVSRFFAPRVGVPEDPVTGSAHCALGPYWAAKFGRGDVVGYQASARGGQVQVEMRGDRVTLIGRAVTTLRGELVTD
jgi:PhzF family phenazine biosynthesis protein